MTNIDQPVNPQRRSVLFRFRLKTLLWLMIPIGAGLFFVREWRMRRRPTWKPFSRAALRRSVESGRVVMVLYTAYWTGTLAMVEAIAVDTPRVGHRLRQLGIVALHADFTNGSADIRQALDDLGEIGVPVVAVYYGTGKHDVIVRSDFSRGEADVLMMLEQAALAKQGYGRSKK